MPLIVKGKHAEGASAPQRVNTERQVQQSELTPQETFHMSKNIHRNSKLQVLVQECMTLTVR